MKKPIKIIIVVFVLALTGYFIYTQFEKKKDLTAGDFTVFGNVEIRQVDVAFRVSGRIKEIFVTEGEQVKMGQEIAILDPRPFEDEMRLAQSDVAVQESTLAKYKAGNRSLEVEQAKAVLKERKATVENTKKTLNRLVGLVTKGAISKQSLEDAQARFDEANARMTVAKDQLNLLVEGFSDEDIAIAQAGVNAAKAKSAKAETAMADTVVYAPQDGVVLTKVKEKGEMIQAGQSVVSLVLNNPVYIRAFIPQPKLGHIKGNEKVYITLDSMPDKEYVGYVGYISPSAEFTPKSVETKEVRADLVFRFRVIVDDVDNVFRQGMPVTLRIVKND